MMNPIVWALTANGRTFGENAKEAGIVTLLGMVAIFTVLALLWLVIELLHRVLVRGDKNKPAPKPEAAPAPVKKPAPAPVRTPAPEKPAPAAPRADGEAGELIAVITAAVAAAMADEGYTGGFRVVSFRRTPTRRNGR